MPGYEISCDTTRGFVVCRIVRKMSDDEVAQMCVELGKALVAARSRGTLRLLWDHRAASAIVDAKAERLMAVWRQHRRVGERIAILVSTSLEKVQGKHPATEEASFFLSENAAHIWLGIGAAQAA